jgi:hypothetical protein
MRGDNSTGLIESTAKWQQVEWRVDAMPDGEMLDELTGLSVSYLFWEGQSTRIAITFLG